MEQNKHFVIAGLTNISARLAWGQLEVFADDVEEIQVLAAGDEGTVMDLRIEVKDDALLVEQPQYGLSLNIMEGRWLQVCIRVPMAWNKEIRLSTISGILRARGLQGSGIYLDTISGDLRGVSLKAEKLSLKTISGDVRAEKLEAKSLSVRSVSGVLALDGVTAESIRGNSISGEQTYHLTNVFSNMEVVAVSGNVMISSPAEKMNVTMYSVSGRVRADGVSETEEKNVPKLRVTGVSADLKLIATKESASC